MSLATPATLANPPSPKLGSLAPVDASIAASVLTCAPVAPVDVPNVTMRVPPPLVTMPLTKCVGKIRPVPLHAGSSCPSAVNRATKGDGAEDGAARGVDQSSHDGTERDDLRSSIDVDYVAERARQCARFVETEHGAACDFGLLLAGRHASSAEVATGQRYGREALEDVGRIHHARCAERGVELSVGSHAHQSAVTGLRRAAHEKAVRRARQLGCGDE